MSIDPVTALLEVGSKVFDRFFPDPAQASAAKLELYKLQQSGELAQITGQLAINQEEAKSTNWFVSSWRPFIGWVCGLACAWNWIGLSVAKFCLTIVGHPITFEPADVSEIMPILMGMLGLGGLRTMERMKGVQRD